MADTDDSKEKLRAKWRRASRKYAETHPDRIKAKRQATGQDKQREYGRKYRVTNHKKILARRRELRAADPIRTAYSEHKDGARARGIAFLMTFQEWLAIWEASGKLSQRGARRGQYVMARYGDQGAYEVGNVRICTVKENHAEWHNGRPLSEEWKRKISEGRKAYHRKSGL